MNLVKENKFSSYFVYKHLTSLEKIKVAVLSKYRFKLIWVLQLLFFHRKKVFSLLTSYRPNAIKTKQNKKTRKDKVIQNVTELPLRHTRKQFPKQFESLV